MKQAIIALFFFLFSISIFAQVPQALNYQGVARDLSGNPIPDQNIGLRISILKNAVNGVIVYQEEHNTSTNNLGLFSLKIGNGTPLSNNFAGIEWGAGDHFIQIEMDESGTGNYQLIGTSQLLSVPYALYAENGSQWGRNLNGLHYLEGNIGIGTNLPEDFIQIKSTDINNSVLSIGTRSLLSNDNIISAAHHLVSKRDFVINLDSTGIPGRRAFSLRLQTATNPITRGKSLFVADIFGNFGIGNFEPSSGFIDNPVSRLHIKDGDIYLDEIGRGVIMKSPNGNCWRMTVSNSGEPVFMSIDCPE